MKSQISSVLANDKLLMAFGAKPKQEAMVNYNQGSQLAKFFLK